MDKVKNVLKIVGVYLAIYIVCSALFVGLFHTPFLAGMEVLMYRGLVFIILCGILSAVVMGVLAHYWKKVEVRDIILMFFMFCAVNTVLFVLIPVTVERSVSVFMLSYMEENDVGYTQQDMEEIFKDKYVTEYGAFEKRFKEQIETGTIRQNPDGTYSITSQGKTIVKMFRLTSKMFNTDERLVYPNESGETS